MPVLVEMLLLMFLTGLLSFVAVGATVAIFLAGDETLGRTTLVLFAIALVLWGAVLIPLMRLTNLVMEFLSV
jgi:hypothetical protein